MKTLSPAFGSLLPLSMLVLGVACAPVDEAETTADDVSVSAPYFRLRQDFRRCISPVCGGVWVSEVNRAVTRCADGSSAAECYVASVDWTALGLGERALPGFQGAAMSGMAVVQGRIMPKTYGTFGNRGEFVATAGWQALGAAAPAGTFYRAQSNGIRCFAAPCPSVDETRLNGGGTRSISGVDLSQVAGLSETDRTKAVDALSRAPGVLVAGANQVVPHAGPAGAATNLVASQVYVQVSAGPDARVWCNADADCTMSAFHDDPATVSECYCAICASTPLNVTTAARNQRDWTRVCSGHPRICPAIACRVPQPAVCVNHACAAGG